MSMFGGLGTSEGQAARDPQRDPTAVVGRRIVAAIIDTLIVALPALALASRELSYLDQQGVGQGVGVPLSDFCDIHRAENEGALCVQLGDQVWFTDGAASPLPFLVSLVLALAFLVVLQGLRGLTPGKAIMGIRTAGADGRPPGIPRAVGRWLLLVVDTAPWLFPLVGLITVLTTVGHRRVGDMATHTFVVSKADADRPIVVPGLGPAHRSPAPPPPVDSPRAGTVVRETAPVRPEVPAATTPPAGDDATVDAPADDRTETTEREPATVPPGDEAGKADATATDTPAAEAKAAETKASDAGETGKDEEDSEAKEGKEAETATAGSGYDPQWDPARNTYIVWEPQRGKWLAWDTGDEEWKPL